MSTTPTEEPSATTPNANAPAASAAPAQHTHMQPTVQLPETTQAASQQYASQQPAMPSPPVQQPPYQSTPSAPAAAAQPVPASFPGAGAYQAATSAAPTHEFGAPAEQPQPNATSATATRGPETTGSQPKSRTASLLAGLAIGALLGGVVGGGVAAIVASNVAQPATTVQGNGTLTLNNTDSATAISGVAAVATPSVVTLQVTGASASGSGSGVIYSEDGYIITNAHVATLDGAAGSDAVIRVKLSDGRILDGEVVGVDPYADLAVVKIDAESLPAITVADSSQLNVGDLTVAIGAPLNLANTVTSGVISSVDRGISVSSSLIPNNQAPEQAPEEDGGSNGFPWDFRFDTPDQGEGGQQQQQQSASGGSVTLPVIQTDASINPGNSGGALLNGDGELIGINVAIASTSTTGDTAGSVGLGFAIPSNLATRVADALIAGEQPSHGLLGASVGDSTQDTDADANRAGGLLIEVNAGGAAEAAGLKPGDVITAVDGLAATDGTSVSALIRMNEGGSKVTISYTRDGEPAETTATLGQLEW